MSAASSPAANPALANLEYVVVDVETTGGPSSTGHRITEVCAVRVSATGEVLEEVNTLVNPDRRIPPGITRLTNINAAMVMNAPRFAEIAPDIQRILRGRVFVAHNAGFDWGFLSFELERAQLKIPPAPVLCTARLAKKLVPEVRSKSLDSLAYYFGVENEARHRAYGDARATVRLLRHLLDRATEHDVYHWADLEQLMKRRAPKRKRIANPHSVDSVQFEIPRGEQLSFDIHPVDDVPVYDVKDLMTPLPFRRVTASPRRPLRVAAGREGSTLVQVARVAEAHPSYETALDATSLAASMPAKRPDALKQALAFLNGLVADKMNQ